MIRALAQFLLIAGLNAYYQYLLIVEWMGYPLFPATTTNDIWQLTRIQIESVLLAAVFAIPTFIGAVITAMVLWAPIYLAELVVKWRLAVQRLHEVNEA